MGSTRRRAISSTIYAKDLSESALRARSTPGRRSFCSKRIVDLIDERNQLRRIFFSNRLRAQLHPAFGTFVHRLVLISAASDPSRAEFLEQFLLCI